MPDFVLPDVDFKTLAVAEAALRTRAADLLAANTALSASGSGTIPPADADLMAEQRAIAEACVAVADAMAEALPPTMADAEPHVRAAYLAGRRDGRYVATTAMLLPDSPLRDDDPRDGVARPGHRA